MSEGRPARNWSLILMAALVAVPALYIRAAEFLWGAHIEAGAVLLALAFGAAIVGAAFIVTWAAEVAQKDISQALALGFVALIAVLPEYAVDVTLAWKAGADPTGPYVSYAAANMTGANRLLVGFGWPLIFLIHWLTRRSSLQLHKGVALELVPLGLATLVSFFVFFQSSIQLWHAAVLLSIFVAYIWLISRAGVEEPELIGPSQTIATLGEARRRVVMVALFLYSILVIVASAEPFTEALLDTGGQFGIDKFILVQWIAPLASEAPELLVASIFALRGNAIAAMIALVSSKVNQWTLLVASLPITYSVSLGAQSALPLDSRQVEEFLLTSAQSLFAIALLVRLRMSWVGALALFVLFGSQLFLTDPDIRYVYAFTYLALAAGLFLVDRGRARQVGVLIQEVWAALKANNKVRVSESDPG